ncbi:hypothetical protein [Corynebacterium freiburgense]|uniref:hypothetical protein n=1 Tax=Corynebacterium freiburgense TaxID=556548 RepID=UPI000414E140|nr:hypothetical protein [Corynebacterium freiburgense]WJZ03108.1 hypothetical protein CFREI_09150 [Corynebacterium freiburgense]
MLPIGHLQLDIRYDFEPPLLDDAEFPQCLASIALSEDLRAVLISNGQPLTQGQVVSLGSNVISLWDLAGETTAQTQVRVRPHCIDGLELTTDQGSAISWLAHPHPFWLLNSHLEAILGGRVVYFAPTSRLLVATRESSLGFQQLCTWAASTHSNAGSEKLFPYGLVYQGGFPQSYTKEVSSAH